MWRMYLKEVMSARARDIGVTYAVLAVPYIQAPPMLANQVYTIDSITTDMHFSKTMGVVMAVRDFLGGSIDDH